MVKHATRILALALAATGLLLSGCGGAKAAKITGLVKLDGKPVDGADVHFVPAQDASLPASGATTGPDGRFEVPPHPTTGETLKPGKYHVFVTKWVERRTRSAPPREEAENLRAAGMLVNILPARYAPPEPESDRAPVLTREITGGDQEVAVLELKSK